MQTSSNIGVAGRFALRALLLAVAAAAAGWPLAAQESDSMQAIVSLCTVTFDSAAKTPRISSQGRACLDDVTLNLQKRPATSLALIGNTRSTEKSGALIAARRAAVVKKYLVREKGVDVTRITLYTGHQDAVNVAIDLLPPGQTVNPTLVTPVNEARLR